MSFTTNSGLYISYINSKAGQSTCIQIKGNNKYIDILFDCGSFNEITLSAKHIFITHGHIDHIGSCVHHARSKSLFSKPSNYYIPEECYDGLIQVKNAFELLDGHEIPMNIIKIRPNQIVEITKNYKVIAFPTFHRVSSQGYAIISRISNGLLPKYANYTKNQIIELRKQNIEINDIIENVDIVYTGDTTFPSLIQSDSASYIFQSTILLIELTYLDGDYKKALKYGHVHIEDIIESSYLFENQQVIFLHVSAKYGPSHRILDMLRKKLPRNLLEKSSVALHSFGMRQYITPLLKRNYFITTSDGNSSCSIRNDINEGDDDIESILSSDNCVLCPERKENKRSKNNKYSNSSSSFNSNSNINSRSNSSLGDNNNNNDNRKISR